MNDKKIKAYFKQQLRVILERSAQEPDDFRSYFQEHEPKDDEILGLLAVSTMMSGEFRVGDSFPTPLEPLGGPFALDPCRNLRGVSEGTQGLPVSVRRRVKTSGDP